jgi:hypothetical protein
MGLIELSGIDRTVFSSQVIRSAMNPRCLYPHRLRRRAAPIVGRSQLCRRKRVAPVRLRSFDVRGRVDRINYVGPTGGLFTRGEQCAFAIDNCVQKPRG